MDKKIALVSIIAFLFVVACSPPVPSANQSLVVNITNASNGLPTETEQLPESPCSPAWVCISSSFRAYQYGNCSIGQREECSDKCEGGTCVKPERIATICTTGFKCMNENIQAFQQEDCNWISKTYCEWGCNNKVCRDKPNATEQSSETTVVVPDIRTLNIGEIQILESSGKQYNLSIYILEESRVRLKLNELKSNWLQPGGNVTFSTGVTIYLRDILFQPYDGGVKAVEYTTG